VSTQFISQPNSDQGIDTYIASGSYADVNLGNSDILNIGTTVLSKSTAYSRGVLQFDLQSIPVGATILSATLTLFRAPGGSLSLPAQFFANRLSTSAWIEFGTTWNRYDGVHSWFVPGGDYTPTDRDSSTIVSSGSDLVFSGLRNLAIDAIEQRLGKLNLLVVGPETGSSNNFIVVYSSDATNGSVRPKLVVTYNPLRLLGVPNFSGGMQELTANLGA
jgi:hypothetical protein